MQKEGAGPEKALRLGVVGGGCSGFSYTMGFDEPKGDDALFTFEDVRVVIDPASREYLDGIIIDYVTGLHGAGFKFENPKATRTCGCGSSFSAWAVASPAAVAPACARRFRRMTASRLAFRHVASISTARCRHRTIWPRRERHAAGLPAQDPRRCSVTSGTGRVLLERALGVRTGAHRGSRRLMRGTAITS
jgi:iron-sulfur cluster assembly protein